METSDPKKPRRTIPVVSELLVGERVVAAAPPPRSERLLSLDAYRGLIMLLLVSSGLGIRPIAATLAKDGHSNAASWQRLAFHVDHPEWLSQFRNMGCSLWDLIQPSFMFMVGAAMVYSYANRKARGEHPKESFQHAAVRAVVLVLLGVFLSSVGRSRTQFVFVNVLSQIGLAYLFVYAMLGRRYWVQLLIGSAILVGYWALFVYYPRPAQGAPAPPAVAAGGNKPMNGQPAKEQPVAADLKVSQADMRQAGNYAGWVRPAFFARFDMLTNPAMRFDGWLLTRFPHEGPYQPNRGGYTTLNFVPSIVTILLGAMAAQLLRGPWRPIDKFLLLVGCGVACMAVGLAAGLTVCPIIKRIWTPSWTLFSAAYGFGILAALYLVVDVLRFRRLGWLVAVVGMNSLAVYLMSQMMKSWIAGNVQTHFGGLIAWIINRLSLAGAEGPIAANGIYDWTYGPMVQSLAVVTVVWLLTWWMYEKKIFIRV